MSPVRTCLSAWSSKLFSADMVALVPNAAATLFSTTRVGQNGRYTFSATQGQNAGVVWSGSTFAGIWSYIDVFRPDGTRSEERRVGKECRSRGSSTDADRSKQG